MLPRSVGMVTNCSAVSLIVPYTLGPGGGALGTETTGSGITTPARSSVVILIASPSFGLGIVAFLAVWIRGRRLSRMVGLGLGGGRSSSLTLPPGLCYDLAGLDIDQLAGPWIKENWHDLDSRKDKPGQSKSERRRRQIEKDIGNQSLQRRIAAFPGFASVPPPN